MRFPLPRILYIIAALSWIILLWPNPVTIFLAACFALLTIQIYKRLRMKAINWRRRMLRNGRPSRWRSFLVHASHWLPITTYTFFILASLVIPIATVALLVSPQAVSGLDRLRELKAKNFQLPPSWVEYIESLRHTLSEYPRIEKIVNDALDNINSMFSDTVGILVSRSFGFVGSTMNLFWLVFLFITMTILFAAYGKVVRKTACRILHVSNAFLGRFLIAIHKALKAIMLGIVFVALVQGILCGIGFAVAGINQPAFWGMLATIVAPIPAVGTALVWLPLCLSLWFTGSTMAAVGLALWGGLFVSGVDNVLRPFFLRQGINASFFVLILSILCGLSVFGAVGLIAGPVLLAIGMQSYTEANRIYRHSR